MAKYLDYAGLQYLWTKIKNYVSTQPLGANVRYDVQSLTDAQKAQARANIAAGGSNENLLDNAYFVGGGSQLGDGVFPINQRGQTSYTAQKSFDRWMVDGNMTVTLQSGNIRVQATAPYVGLYQAIPMSRLKNGETYTFSIILDGNMVTQTFVLNADGNWNNIYYGGDWYIPYVCANGVCQFKVVNSISSFDHTIKAVKLEKGTVSTLANDVPPDFGEELRKCLRYLWVYKVGANTTIGSGVTFGTSSAIDIVTPVPMRAGSVTASFNVTPYIVYDGGLGICDAGAAIITHNGTGNHLRWQIGHSGTNIQGHSLVMLLAGNDTTFTFSNEP